MDEFQIQENWNSICRKFPLVAFISAKDEIEIVTICKSVCPQFDHVVILCQEQISSQQNKSLSNFLSNERIINLTIVPSENVKGQSLLEKSKFLASQNLKNSIAVVVNKLTACEKNVRWIIFDKVKEMKSPFTDVLSLDEKGIFSMMEKSFIVFWSHS